MNDANIAIAIPLEVNSNMPVNKPKNPDSVVATTAACVSECPNEDIGTRAPPPPNLINLSYKPNISKNEPMATYIIVKYIGNSLNRSIITCANKQFCS